METEADQEMDYYSVLGLTPKASPAELKRAYRSLAQKYHPDHGHADSLEEFVKITKAYETLIDPERRNEYNKEKGFGFFEDINKLDRASVEPSSKSDAVTRPVEIKVDSHIVNSTQKWDQLRRNVPEGDLRVGDKVALNKPDENRSPADPADNITPWGEIEGDSGGKSKIGSSIGNLLGRLRKKGTSAKRQELKSRLRRSLDEEMHPKQPAVPQRAKPAAPHEEVNEKNSSLGSEFRGDRIFNFQITTIERVQGTQREIVLPNSERGEENRRIKVRIPKEVPNGAVIEVSRGWERFLVRVTVSVDAYFAVQKSNLIAYVPLTVKEAVSGISIELATTEGSARVKIPPKLPAGEAVIIHGEGIRRDDSSRGVLKVYPFIVPPGSITPGLTEALKQITQAGESVNVRAGFRVEPLGEKFLQVYEDSAVLLVPITLAEAIEGFSMEITTPAGPASMKLPSPWLNEAPILLPRHGPLNSNSGKRLDLHIRPLISLPADLTDETRAAITAIEQHYQGNVRSQIPRRLKPLDD